MHKYRRILLYARPYWHFFAGIFLLTVTASALAALQPWPMKLLVDHVLGDTPVPPALDSLLGIFSASPTAAGMLLLVVAGGLVLFALHSLVDTSLTWAWTVAGRRLVYDLARDLFARLQRRSLLFHSRTPVGDTITRITGDSWCGYQLVDALLFAPLHALFTTAAMIFLMAQLDAALTVLALVTAPFMVAASFLVGKPLRETARLRREIESRIHSHLQQTLSGIPVVQAFVQEDREQRRFAQFADASIRAQQRGVLIGGVNSLSTGLITTLGAGLILWIGARHVVEGSLTLGGLLVFLPYLNSLQTQIRVLATVYTALQGVSASVDRVTAVLAAEPEIADRPTAGPLPPVRGHVQIEDVTFGYEKDRPVLRNVSLNVSSGETIALVGATGAGKSTLVSLIPRFIDPWQGRVLIDGQDARDVTLHSLRDQVALLLQEPFLFPFSVARNIAYGRPDATRAEVEAAARAANAHGFIELLPQGYDTAIGEHGAMLSGGERQRLAIARALLKNAPILILDEPTSALDAGTEHLLMEAMERLRKDRTTFIIAHRLSTVRRASRIVVLDNGRIVECGTHDELLAHGRLYARFHNIQFEWRETADALH